MTERERERYRERDTEREIQRVKGKSGSSSFLMRVTVYSHQSYLKF